MVRNGFKSFGTTATLAIAGLSTTAMANNLDTVRQLAGCFVVDYSYSETTIVDPAYTLDSRVYDVQGMTVKELIRVVDEDSSSVRLQRFMQAENLQGDVVFMMRHHGEIWREAPTWRYRYDGRFDGKDRWGIESLADRDDAWVRVITNLDDGLRYDCLGGWKADHAASRFECDSFAPIPGRETRDMGRRDYNTMDRTAAVVVYGDSWLERQANTKVDFAVDGTRRPLVEEVGKIWQARLPDTECNTVAAWADERQPFWDVLADVWAAAHDGVRPFHEIKEVNGTTRGAKIKDLFNRYYRTIATNPAHRDIVTVRLAEIIEAHRE